MQQQIKEVSIKENIEDDNVIVDPKKSMIRIDSKFTPEELKNDIPEGGDKSVEIFMERRNLLLGLINGTKNLLTNIRSARNNWPVQYPISKDLAKKREEMENNKAKLLAEKKKIEENEKEVKEKIVSNTTLDLNLKKNLLKDQIVEFDDENLKVLHLNLVVDNYTDAMASAWDNATIAHLDSKILESTRHLEKLYQRISDTSSKVLITGDLNAGKSTFVNAVLRKSVVPQDQQPCTAGFCEVIDAKNNNGIEEVHAINDPEAYNREDPTTFDRYELAHLNQVVTDNIHHYNLYKIYCYDDRKHEESLLNNGVVDISLIDSPGLNIDSLKTMALFAQQEEIDVIIFMVNAENHFTLSGKEFLTNAGKEKGYIFIVINRFDQIEDKERCKRDILTQIKKISPNTYADADNLVHFVSAKECLKEHQKGNPGTEDFNKLEKCLRSFVLEKRCKSKLNPAKLYLQNILKDINYISKYNAQIKSDEMESIQGKIDSEMPNYYNLMSVKEEVSDDIDKIIDTTSNKVQAFTKDYLTRFMKELDRYSLEVEYQDFLHIWKYATELRNHLYQLAAKRASYCAKYGHTSASECIENVKTLIKDANMDESLTVVLNAANLDTILGEEEFLAPKINDDKKEKIKIRLPRIRSSISPDNINNVNSQKIIKAVNIEISDFFDLQDQLELIKNYIPSVAMLASGVYGYHKLASQLLSVGNRIGVENIAKAGFIMLGVAGLGSLAYAVSNMKNCLERKVTQKVRQHLRDIEFVDANVDRISKNTRRSLRVVLWDFHNQFTKTFDMSVKKRAEFEHELRISEDAKEFFNSLAQRSEELGEIVSTIDLDATI